MCVATTGWPFSEKVKQAKLTSLPAPQSILQTNQRRKQKTLKGVRAFANLCKRAGHPSPQGTTDKVRTQMTTDKMSAPWMEPYAINVGNTDAGGK